MLALVVNFSKGKGTYFLPGCNSNIFLGGVLLKRADRGQKHGKEMLPLQAQLELQAPMLRLN